MKDFGCITPFSAFAENGNDFTICTDPDKVAKPRTLFQSIVWKNLTEQNLKCPKPCKHLKSIVGVGGTADQQDYGHIEIKFQREIKISRTRISYGVLELMAEVGGYFGLFLGVSINQLSTFVKKCFDKTKRLSNLFN